MESDIKIRTSLKRMQEEFKKSDSKYYYIKNYHHNGKIENDNRSVVFECLIRHNEIGNNSIERGKPYSFEELEKELEIKCEEYAKSIKSMKVRNKEIER